MHTILWHLTLGTRGGLRRAGILDLLEPGGRNAHEVALLLGMDYKTARHHLGVLVRNGLLVAGQGYGARYQWSAAMRSCEAPWRKLRLAHPDGAARPRAKGWATPGVRGVPA